LLFLLAVPKAWCQASDPQVQITSPVVLQWGFVYMPPLVYLGKDGQAQGTLADIMAGTSLHSGIPYEPLEFPNVRAIYSLNQQKINFAIGVKSLVNNPNMFVFSAFPVAKMQLNIVWRKGTEAVSSIEDLEGKRLVLLAGYTYAGLRPKFEEIAKSAIEVETHDRAVGALKLKRGNYALLYKTASTYSIALDEQLDFESLTVSEVDLYFTLNKTVPDAEQFMQRLEAGFLAYQQGQIISKDQAHP
jgi:polar amino acid transport system substrate-binding protein